MNSKTKKGLRLAAAAIFAFALALNIKITLDDPFLSISDIAIAQTYSCPHTGYFPPRNGSCSCNNSNNDPCNMRQVISYQHCTVTSTTVYYVKAGATLSYDLNDLVGIQAALDAGYSFSHSTTTTTCFEGERASCPKTGNCNVCSTYSPC